MASYLQQIGVNGTSSKSSLAATPGAGTQEAAAKRKPRYWYEPGYVPGNEKLGPIENDDDSLPAPGAAAPAVWWRHNAFRLCADGDEAAYYKKADFLDEHSVSSLRGAVEALNTGRVECSGRFCVVHETEEHSFYVLYRFGRRGEALAHFGISDPGCPAPKPGAESIEVLVRHGTQSGELKVLLPKRAKFHHVKFAIARHMGTEEMLRKGFLVKKEGVYTNFKDGEHIRDVRQVLVAGISLTSTGGTVALDDGEVSEEEPDTVVNGEPSWMERLEERLASIEEAGSAVKTPGAKLTYPEAINLQKELLEGFKDEGFQHQLKALQQGSYKKAEFIRKRQELFLYVQAPILPKYGFEPTQTGVLKMMGMMKPYVEVPQFARIASEINGLLGLEMPQEKWRELSRDCQQLAVADSQREDGIARSYIPDRGS